MRKGWRWLIHLGLATGAVLCLRPVAAEKETPKPAKPKPAKPKPAQPKRAKPKPACTPQPMPKQSYPVREGMVQIPGGTFCMGSNDGADDEKPVHAVTVNAFELDATEVTVGQYRPCVKAGKCSSPSTGEYCNWNKSGREDHPVNCVSWDEARTYCKWADKRLPTEEEWEYAARGTDGRTYPWGNEPPSEQLCWNRWQTKAGTCKVDSFPTGNSPFGAQDMAGNVWEWTETVYCESYAKNAPCKQARVVRGGGWGNNIPSDVRAANRDGDGPSSRFLLGFRCAR